MPSYDDLARKLAYVLGLSLDANATPQDKKWCDLPGHEVQS